MNRNRESDEHEHEHEHDAMHASNLRRDCPFPVLSQSMALPASRSAPTLKRKTIYTSNPLAQPLGSPVRPSPFLLPPIDALAHERNDQKDEPFANSDEPALLVAMSLRDQRRKLQQQQQAEEKLARRLEREISGRTLRKALHKSKSSFAISKKTDLEPLRAEQEKRGEKRFLLRFSSEAALRSIKDARGPWRPSGHTQPLPSAEALLLQPPPPPPLLPRVLAEAEALERSDAGGATQASSYADQAAQVQVSVRAQVALMVRGFTESEAYNHVLQRQLRRLRQLRDGTVAAAAAAAEEEDEEDEHEAARKALEATLHGGRASRPLEHRRVVDMFHLLDCDPDGFVSRSVLPTTPRCHRSACRHPLAPRPLCLHDLMALTLT